MLRIDMLEEPEDENDLILKAINIECENDLHYAVPYKFDDVTIYEDVDYMLMTKRIHL